KADATGPLPGAHPAVGGGRNQAWRPAAQVRQYSRSGAVSWRTAARRGRRRRGFRRTPCAAHCVSTGQEGCARLRELACAAAAGFVGSIRVTLDARLVTGEDSLDIVWR